MPWAGSAWTWAKNRRMSWPILLSVGVAAVLVAGLGFVGVVKATDVPAFCGSFCHEMAPFHAAWADGGHKGIACVECHVDPGLTAHVEHKVVAAQELYDHFVAPPKFPLAKSPDVPDSRCVRCHPSVVVNEVGFSHADHARRGPCVMCHVTAGHQVSPVALRSAGVLRVSYSTSAVATAPATVDHGRADLAGHVAVPCSRCHDMAATPCSACHKPTKSDVKHPARADCTTCHATGAAFVFTHPTTTDCGSCHNPSDPTKHPSVPGGTACTTCHLSAAGTDWAFTHPSTTTCGVCHKPKNQMKHPSIVAGATCTTCHASPGKTWAFSHPGIAANCATCHDPSGANHTSRTDCTSCHKSPGKSWAFSHPGIGASCGSCHTPTKANHPSRSNCSACHRSPGSSWAFSHPGAGAGCSSCHTRPATHNPAACQMCHRNAGKSWAFSHPRVSSGCVSCHASKEPANHYGTSCGSCHSPSRAWTDAVFHHPAIPGGQHSSTSFACTKCHPGTGHGPGHYCSCHGNTTGG